MSEIKRINNFIDETNKGVFGLSIKTCFRVKEPFNVEFIIKYESSTGQGPYKMVSEEWEILNTKEGDFIFTSGNEAFLILDKENNYVRCRPESLRTSEEAPDLRRFDIGKLEKIGPIDKLGYSIPFNKREEILIGRGL